MALSVRRRGAGMAMAMAMAIAIAVAPLVVAPASGAGTLAPYTVTPGVGLAPVSLGETAGAVSRQLGLALSSPGTGYFVYPYRGADLEVAFGAGSLSASSRVEAVAATAKAATVYGKRLTLGPKALAPLLRAHGWQVVGCNSGHVPSAGIRLKSGVTVIQWTTAGPQVTVQRSSPYASPCDWPLA